MTSIREAKAKPPQAWREKTASAVVAAVTGLVVGLVHTSIWAAPPAERSFSAEVLATLPAAARQPIRFERDVYPLLKQKCFKCHAGANAEAGYRLDLHAELLGETNGEPLVEAGASAKSRLIHAVAGLDPKQVMPPEGARLTAAEIGLLRAWIDQGAGWDDTLLPPLPATSPHWSFQPIRRPAVPDVAGPWGASAIDAFVATRHKRLGLRPTPPAERSVLARRLSLVLTGLPPTADELQAVIDDSHSDWYERAVDRLLESPHYAEHIGRYWLDIARWAESEGFESNHPRPSAWRYRDYVVRAFQEDRSFAQFLTEQIAGDELPEKRDEHLIATGFLAAARISSNEEDKALQRNQVQVDMVNAVGTAFLGLTLHCAQCHTHKFDPITIRDYYRLHAFFVRGQPTNVRLESAEAEGAFLRAGGKAELEPLLLLREAYLATARTKLEEQVLEKLSAAEREVWRTPIGERTAEQELQARQVRLKLQFGTGEVERAISATDRPFYDDVKKRLAALEKTGPAVPQTFAFYSPVTSPHRWRVMPQLGFYPLPFDAVEFAQTQPYIMIRGDVHALGPRVTPGWPSVLDAGMSASASRTSASVEAAGLGKSAAGRTSSEGGSQSSADRRPGAREMTRLDLARWLADPKHPLVSRVWANRLWQFAWGEGLVRTPDDFGLRGEPPSHPELLDWLAAEFVENGFRTKPLLRRIVLAQSFQQGSRPFAATSPGEATTARPETVRSETARSETDSRYKLDPENRLLWHYRSRRQAAEVLHDALLVTSGELDRRVGGASVPLDQRETSTRRNLYLFQRRGAPTDVQRLFDGPNECAESASRRTVSLSALQSLYLLNGPFALARARKLAAEIDPAGRVSPETAVRRAFERTLQRQPTAAESQSALRFWTARTEPMPPGNATDATGKESPSVAANPPLVLLCHALLNSNEFLTVP